MSKETGLERGRDLPSEPVAELGPESSPLSLLLSHCITDHHPEDWEWAPLSSFPSLLLEPLAREPVLCPAPNLENLLVLSWGHPSLLRALDPASSSSVDLQVMGGVQPPSLPWAYARCP